MKVCPDCKQPEGAQHIELKRGDHPISAKMLYQNPRRISWAGALVGAALVDAAPDWIEAEE